MTKAVSKTGLAPVASGRYFLARFLGFALGVNGSGGLLSMARSRSSVRLLASPAGRRSSLAISARIASSVFVVLALFMIGV